MDKKTWRNILVGVSLLVGLVLFFFVILKNKGIFQLLGRIEYIYLVPFAVFSLIIFLLHVMRWKYILESHGIKLRFPKLFLAALAGYAVSYVTPSAQVGGEPVKALLIKSQKVKFHVALSSVIIDKYVELTSNVLMGIVGFVILIFHATISSNGFLVIGLTLSLSAVVLYAFYYRTVSGRPFVSLIFNVLRFRKLEKLKQNVVNSEKLMTKFWKHKGKAQLIAFFFSFAAFFAMFFEYYYLMKAFGFESTFIQIFLVCTVVAVAYIIPVPAALGALEIGQTNLFAVLSYDPLIGLGLSLIIRLRDSIYTALGFVYILKRSINIMGLGK
jgi:uncharacterized protein (TIRG00374 family)